jgi:hypothetical protein
MSSIALNHGRRVSPAAQWARTLASFALVLACTAAVGHRYGMVETLAFFWVLALVTAIAIVSLLCAMFGFRRLWMQGDKAGKASFAATLLASIVLTPFAVAGYLAYTTPPLHDVSTDLVDPPPLRRAALERTAQMNAVTPYSAEMVAVQRLAYPDVTGRRLDASMERAVAAVQAVVASYGWRVRTPWPTEFETVSEIVVELEAPSYILRLPADAALRLTDEDESIFVDLRLNSRYGRYDIGENARRIRRFMNDVDAEFARQSLLIIDIPASSDGEDAAQ